MKRPSSPPPSSPTTRAALTPLDVNTLNSSTASSSSSSPYSTIQPRSSSSLTTPQNNQQSTRHNRTTSASSSSNFSTQFSNLFDASSYSSSPNYANAPSSSATTTASAQDDSRMKDKKTSEMRMGEEGSAFKKRRLEKVNLVSQFDTGRKMQALLPGRNQQISVFEMNRLRGMGIRVGSNHLSMRPYLRDFVSHNEKEIFRCPSFYPNADYAAPYSLAFSNGAKSGGRQVFAVGDHDGTISFLDAGKDAQWHAEQSHNYISAHLQAVFDLLWSPDDKTIATASGDSTSKLFDVETKQCTGTLLGHTGTIKKIDWNQSNPNILATASRDGSIRIWDRRIPGTDSGPRRGPQATTEQPIATVNHIKNAHGTKGKPSKGFSAVKSVTSLAYLPQRDMLLASSGSYNGTIKVWDLRRSHSRRVNPEEMESNEGAVSSLALPRSYGIGSLALSPNGQKLYAYSRDSKIYAFDPLNLTQAAPLAVYSDKRMTSDSFYVHLAISPCSRYLASGSSDHGVYLFDTEGPENGGVKLNGHEKETLSLDWSQDKIVSCSDDSLVRVWKYDSVNSRRAREDEVIRWRWSGSEE